MDFFGDCGAAHNLAPFKHESLQASLGQVAGGYQAVVTTADDDDVVIRHSRLGVLKTIFSRGFARMNADLNRTRIGTEPGKWSGCSFQISFQIRVSPSKSAAKSYFLSFNICSAAFLPGAPMMPPPGCVAEPHM